MSFKGTVSRDFRPILWDSHAHIAQAKMVYQNFSFFRRCSQIRVKRESAKSLTIRLHGGSVVNDYPDTSRCSQRLH